MDEDEAKQKNVKKKNFEVISKLIATAEDADGQASVQHQEAEVLVPPPPPSSPIQIEAKMFQSSTMTASTTSSSSSSSHVVSDSPSTFHM
jgi:hypothetical protein